MLRSMHFSRVAARGFTLIEIALVLIIAGFALGSALSIIGPQIEQHKYTSTQQQLKAVNDAVVAFAMVNRRLPCPASTTSAGRESFCTNATGACGAENVAAGAAATARGRCFALPNAGFVPAITLSLGGTMPSGLLPDSFGGPLRYQVNAAQNTTLNNPSVGLAVPCSVAAPCYPFSQPDGIRNAYYSAGTQVAVPTSLTYVCRSSTGITASSCGTAMQLANPSFVVYSYGRNAAVLLGADESANTNADSVYVLHEPSDTAAANGAFDDLFDWFSMEQLLSKMQGGGVLP